ncbi:hypothetical protein QLL95_gp0674 [Cotonvirus japonicus]|uniref:Uncharacterized protein n=1 Tax=Cotonvirus japonicus TaxID=2811091 RepID=A0ABM7NTJ1_9VIRU|nr:hypothetical protein QLL95_gp0674 [Cotonvirus japonicus]BCS83449.1 hypothetical protein [Cotonvirus japonicus]
MRQVFNRNQRVPGTFRVSGEETGYKKIQCVTMNGTPFINLIAKVNILQDSEINLDSQEKAEVDSYIVEGVETFGGKKVPNEFFRHYRCHPNSMSFQTFYPGAIIKKEFICGRGVDFYFEKNDAKKQKLNPRFNPPKKIENDGGNISNDEYQVKYYLKQQKLLEDIHSEWGNTLKKRDAAIDCMGTFAQLSRNSLNEEEKYAFIEIHDQCEKSFTKSNKDLIKHKEQSAYIMSRRNYICGKIKENEKAYQILKTKKKSDYCIQ